MKKILLPILALAGHLLPALLFAGLALYLVAFFPSSARGTTGLWDYSFIFSDEPTVSFAWDAVSSNTCPPAAVCGYEIELRQLENPLFIDKYVVAGLENTTVVAHYKKSGHYKLYARTFAHIDETTFEYSEWTDATQSGVISLGFPQPTQKGWLLYWRLPPPGGGEIK